MKNVLLTVVTVALFTNWVAAKDKNGVTAFVFTNGTEAFAITVFLNGGEIATLEPGEVLTTPVDAGTHLIEAEAMIDEQTVFRSAFCVALEGVLNFVSFDETVEDGKFSITCREPDEQVNNAGARELVVALLACCGLGLVYGSAALVARRG